MPDPFEPTHEELKIAEQMIIDSSPDQLGTLYSEREFMENLLVQRLNALLLVYSIFIAAAFASQNALLAGAALIVGSITCFMMEQTVRRAHYKHHWIMRLFYNQPDSSAAARHPIRFINEAMKPKQRARLAGGSVSAWVGRYIPFFCWFSLLLSGLAAIVMYFMNWQV